MTAEKTTWTEAELRAAYSAASLPLAGMRRSERVGCFSCRRVFLSTELNARDQTCRCPTCGVAAVLPEREVPDIRRPGFFEAMSRFWF